MIFEVTSKNIKENMSLEMAASKFFSLLSRRQPVYTETQLKKLFNGILKICADFST